MVITPGTVAAVCLAAIGVLGAVVLIAGALERHGAFDAHGQWCDTPEPDSTNADDS